MQPLCIDCKYYEARDTETEDRCQHDKAVCGGVRSLEYFRCSSMRAGICSDGKLFEAANQEASGIARLVPAHA